MNKHTPAPWSVQECPSGGMVLLRTLKDNRHPQSHLQIVPASDAILMSAAPDLLEALESLVTVAKKAKSPTFSIPGEPSYLIEEGERKNAKDWLLNTKNWLPQAEEALSKAKGKSL